MNLKKLNNKGFTLVELLVVIVILVSIVTLAIPSLTSSMQRSKDKIKKQKIEVLGALAEQYLTEKQSIKAYNCFKDSSKCSSVEITVNSTSETFNGKLSLSYLGDYVEDEDLVDADGNCLYKPSENSSCDSGCISYDTANKKYEVGDCEGV